MQVGSHPSSAQSSRVAPISFHVKAKSLSSLYRALPDLTPVNSDSEWASTLFPEAPTHEFAWHWLA
jgi:hypothetical protein